ncbi:hypothetical protein Scep_000628 [Stephania cephalantha]|uniref:Large ribosomal subunit protein bL12 C-terminal domain-containing protein n=1 Tax=Stephania cephalantha TaxID=152367 RepID=A0AAP0L801_9MAGN
MADTTLTIMPIIKKKSQIDEAVPPPLHLSRANSTNHFLFKTLQLRSSPNTIAINEFALQCIPKTKPRAPKRNPDQSLDLRARIHFVRSSLRDRGRSLRSDAARSGGPHGGSAEETGRDGDADHGGDDAGDGGGREGRGEGEEGEGEEKKAEKTTFDLKLEGFEAAAKIKIIKEVRSFTDLGLKEAKDLVEKAPAVLKKGVAKEEAEKIIEKMKEAGAKVVME